MRYRLQRHDGTDCSATMVPITVLRMVPIQRYRQRRLKGASYRMPDTLQEAVGRCLAIRQNCDGYNRPYR